MQSYLKTKPVWIQLLLFLSMAIGIFMVVGFFGSLVLIKLTGFSITDAARLDNGDFSQKGAVGFMRGLLLLQFIGLFAGPSLLFAYLIDKKHLTNYIGLKAPYKPIFWLLSIAALLVAIPLIDYIGALNQKINFGSLQQWVQSTEAKAAKQTQALLAGKSTADLIMNVVFIALFAAVGEELFFRGVLQRLFIRSTKNAWAGIIIAAFLFSFFHFQFLGFFPRFALGIILGALYWYSGSIWTSIIAHFVYDGFIVVLLFYRPELGQAGETAVFSQSNFIVMALFSAVLVAGLFWLMKKNAAAAYTAIDSTGQRLPADNDITF